MSEQHIQELALEEVMGDRFGRYSKYIIQDRALPDIRDGLKPVQRRILFAMHVDGNTHDKNFRKSAKTVGNVIANYHPHGDTSVYDAMVRLSQNWKQRDILVEMHGNNGSMDGDSAAAMRYTEARLAKIASELLLDIDKDTVDFVWNFDDTSEEPTVLPARFPNLLVNGATGISAGYATDIPPHNLGEVIDATIHLIDHPRATASDLMTFIKGPDFPTGAIVQGADGLREAYETGRGKVVLRSQTRIEPLRGGKQQLVINELPYDVNKATLVKKIDELRINRKIEGIAEVRDESDRSGLQIVVELKKDVHAQGILNYLLKNTDLQVIYHFNMVAINNRRPEQVNLPTVLQAYIDHQRQVVLRRTRYNCDKAQARLHLVDGLMKALSILDEVIALIRNSRDKSDAKNNLVTQYQFSQEQAEAIVSLQLYRLTNTDITALQNEKLDLGEQIAHYQSILKHDKTLLQVMKQELRDVKKQFATERQTRIEAEVSALTIETEVLVPEEEVMVVVSRGGYYKRSSLRSVAASNEEPPGLREGDQAVFMATLSTRQQLVLFTSRGNYLHFPVHELPDDKWKGLGEHLSQSISMEKDEQIIAAFVAQPDAKEASVLLVSKEGMIKQTLFSEFQTYRSYKTRSNLAMKLKSSSDRVVAVRLLTQQQDHTELLLATHLGFGLRYFVKEVPIVGARASGVKAINLKTADSVVGMAVFHSTADSKQQILCVTQRGGAKRMVVSEINRLGRAKRGLMMLKELKQHPHRFILLDDVRQLSQQYIWYSAQGQSATFAAREVPLFDRLSNGSTLVSEKEAGSLTAAYALVDQPSKESNPTAPIS